MHTSIIIERHFYKSLFPFIYAQLKISVLQIFGMTVLFNKNFQSCPMYVCMRDQSK